MGAIKDSIKIIGKSEEEIDALKSLVDGFDFSEEDKSTIIYGDVSVDLYNLAETSHKN